MQFTQRVKLKTWIISIIALILFIVPVYFNGQWTITLGIFADSILLLLEAYLGYIVLTVAIVCLVIATYGTFINRNIFEQSPAVQEIFVVDGLWYTLRLIGTVFAFMILFQIGPEIITSDLTGGTMMYDLVPILATWLFMAAFLMPLLMNFGLMELVGTFLEKVIRPLFKVPGRSSIDALASWMGSAPVGVMITTQQYERGFYTKREAAIIATNFSVVSIPFSLVIARFIGLEHYFLPLYFSIAVACLFTALVMVRIPPLSKGRDTYYEETGKQIDERKEGDTLFETATIRAYKRTSESGRPINMVKDGLTNALDIYGGLIPVVIGIGTIALIIAEYTPLFTVLGYPIGFLLELLNVPEAYEAAPAFLIGIADMFLPSVIGSGLESEFTRFLIAVVSLTQIIYFSEVGALLLKSKIPISLWQLIWIFALRTVISFPIIYALAWIFVGGP